MRRMLLIVLGLAALVAVALLPIALRHMHPEAGMTNRHGVRAALAAIGAMLAGGESTAALAVPPTTIGVSVGQPTYSGKARALANLAAGSNWFAMDHHAIGLDEVDEQGNVKKLLPGMSLTRILTPPNLAEKNPTIRCTWTGKGTLKINGRRVQGVRYDARGFTYVLDNSLGPDGSPPVVALTMSEIDTSDPIRNIDCRETTMPVSTRIDPTFVASLRGFRILRFMDWQNTNDNAPVTWQTRHLPGAIDTTRRDGVAIEDMIALAKEAGTDAWFNMPYNSDDDYYERFARMVHDNLPPDRTVYVEMGNEVWNHGFKVAGQAQSEGQAANLSDNGNKAGLLRYAQRLAHVMDIWKKVYADRPHRLVRVAACQNMEWCARTVLGYGDTARHVDAMATAPYFGARLNNNVYATPAEMFADLDGEIDRTIGLALQVKAVAAQFGKRYIAYEGGQHLIFKDVAFEQQVERDPRMYDAYKKYLDLWREKIGDTISLWISSGVIGRWGGWGLVEYIGQPLSDAPKMRAVRDQIALTQSGKTAR